MHRLYHDFNSLYPGREKGMCSAPLVCHGTKCDLEELSLSLKEGMRVLLYQQDDVRPDGSPDCLEVQATIRFDKEANCFMADFVWDELMYRSEAEAKKR